MFENKINRKQRRLETFFGNIFFNVVYQYYSRLYTRILNNNLYIRNIKLTIINKHTKNIVNKIF